MARRQAVRVGIDTGGTFTDAVLSGPAGRRRAKVPSTPARPEQAFLAALGAVAGTAGDALVRHGTTVGTNAVLTRAGARVVFVTTAGFEDLPWIGRGVRADLHALVPARPAPLVARGASVGVAERVDAAGRVVLPLDAGEIERVVAEVAARRPAAIALCLVHALRRPAHERRLGRALRALGVPVHVSSAGCADPREAERAATTVIGAYVAPVLGRYLAAVAGRLRPATRRRLTVMRSDGGRMAVAEVAAVPARTLLSGPAAGVSAAQDLACRHGLARVLSFDVGGTSTDVAWIEGEHLAVAPTLRVGAFEASVPSVGIETVGAGGGSLVDLDTGGALRIGPASAGAVPGPACYGQGGPFALTDAWLLRGHIPAALLGGAFALEPAAAERAGRRLARRAGCTLRQLCDGALEVAAVTTARALRLASVAQGHDPRRAALVAFGGAGPVLAASTAALLGIESVLVPDDPGTFAAEGALHAPLRADAEAIVPGAVPAAVRARLVGHVRAVLRREGARGIRLRTEIDARYAGQAFEVTVPERRGWQRAFHAQHEARYGFALPAAPVEAVRVRVRGEGRDAETPGSAQTVSRRRFRTLRAARAERDELRPGMRLVGPARIEELSGTTWVPGGWCAEVLHDRALRLRRLS